MRRHLCDARARAPWPGRARARDGDAPRRRKRAAPALKRAGAVPHGRDAPAGDLAPPPCLRRLASRARARLAPRRHRARPAPAGVGADAAVRARRPPRRGRPRRGGAGLDRARLHGAVLVAVRADGRARRRPAARHRRGALWPQAVAPASLITPSARAVAIAARARHALGLRQRAPHRRASSGRRADRRPAGGAARLHDRADQRHPRRPDDQAAVRARRSSTR